MVVFFFNNSCTSNFFSDAIRTLISTEHCPQNMIVFFVDNAEKIRRLKSYQKEPVSGPDPLTVLETKSETRKQS